MRLPHSRQNRDSGGPEGGAPPYAGAPYAGGDADCGIAGAWMMICGTWPGANAPHAVATNFPSRGSTNPCAYPAATAWEISISASAGVFLSLAATSCTPISRRLLRLAPTVWRTLSCALARQERKRRIEAGGRGGPHAP